MVRAPSFPHLVEGSLGSSLEAFLDAAEAFFSNLAAVHWGALAFALLLHFGHMCCRSRAWFNTLRAAYPHERFQWRRIPGAYLAGVGRQQHRCRRARGDVAKIYLAKHSVPNSSYPAVTSSFFVESLFDITVGLARDAVRDHAGRAPEPRRACRTCPRSTSPSGPTTRASRCSRSRS